MKNNINWPKDNRFGQGIKNKQTTIKCRMCDKKLKGIVIIDTCLDCYQKNIKRNEEIQIQNKFKR